MSQFICQSFQVGFSLSISDFSLLSTSHCRPRDQLMRYDRILKDVVMCAQKEYLHGVGIAKVCIIIVLHVVLMSVIRCAAKTGLVLFVGVHCCIGCGFMEHTHCCNVCKQHRLWVHSYCQLITLSFIMITHPFISVTEGSILPL